ncbi:MAG: hypothetical protein Tsb0016_18380 [Sphingomonadales bacterium]
MRNTLLTYCTAAFVGLVATPAMAGVITNMTFDTDPILSDTPAPGVWYTDRRAPAAFDSVNFMGDQRLRLGLSEADGVSGFTATQGRGFDTPGATRLSIDMFIASDWQLLPADERVGGIWGVGLNSNGDRSLFPIIEFFDSQFQVFDSIDAGDGTGWRPAGLPSDFLFDQFHNLAIELNAGVVDFFINGSRIATEEIGSTVELGSVILQGINTPEGVDRNLYFDNFVASSAMDVSEPSALLVLFGGLLGLGVAARRRR